MLGALLAGVVAFGVALARSATPGCSVPPPELQLPEQLRAVGEFDQPFDTADVRSLGDAAVRAATALHSDLAGSFSSAPARVEPDPPARYTALVFPLSQRTGPEQSSKVVGLVAFLLDCGGRAYYHDVDDLLRTDPSLLPTGFPTVDRDTAAARLGVAAPRLVWSSSPFDPVWLDPASRRSIAAGVPA
jgi:hypothetical protein